MRVLITGATGFVGQHLVPLLIAGENETAILVREAYGMGQPLPASLAAIRDRLQVVYADLRNYRLTGRALQQAQPDVVFHLAAAGVADPFLAVDTAIQLNGARGYSKDTILEWIYRYARSARIVDGASEVHKMVLANVIREDGSDFWRWSAGNRV